MNVFQSWNRRHSSSNLFLSPEKKKKKRARNLLLLTLRQEISFLGLQEFFTIAENPLTQLCKYLGMLQIHASLEVNNEFTGEITALLNYHTQQLNRRIVFANCY